MTPELSRRLPVGRIGPGGTEITVEANPEECAKLARRLSLPAVQALSCRFRLHAPDADGAVEADGVLSARVVQTCVVTLDEFPANVADAFTVRFVPARDLSEAEEAVVDPDADDDIPYVGDSIDLGEAATEQLALALDPYPRKPGAEAPAEVTGAGAPAGESDRPNPFAALAKLRGTPS
jgi:uncharacterized metal-binding protein YceD (DUF177 family)